MADDQRRGSGTVGERELGERKRLEIEEEDADGASSCWRLRKWHRRRRCRNLPLKEKGHFLRAYYVPGTGIEYLSMSHHCAEATGPS